MTAITHTSQGNSRARAAIEAVDVQVGDAFATLLQTQIGALPPVTPKVDLGRGLQGAPEESLSAAEDNNLALTAPSPRAPGGVALEEAMASHSLFVTQTEKNEAALALVGSRLDGTLPPVPPVEPEVAKSNITVAIEQHGERQPVTESKIGEPQIPASPQYAADKKQAYHFTTEVPDQGIPDGNSEIELPQIDEPVLAPPTIANPAVETAEQPARPNPTNALERRVERSQGGKSGDASAQAKRAPEDQAATSGDDRKLAAPISADAQSFDQAKFNPVLPFNEQSQTDNWSPTPEPILNINEISHVTTLAQNDIDSIGSQELPLRQVELQNQVALLVQRAIKDQHQKITVQLHPEDLGEIEITIETTRDNRVNAFISVDRPETLELLARDQKQLEKLVGQNGIQPEGSSINLSLRQGSHQDQRQKSPERQPGSSRLNGFSGNTNEPHLSQSQQAQGLIDLVI